MLAPLDFSGTNSTLFEVFLIAMIVCCVIYVVAFLIGRWPRP